MINDFHKRFNLFKLTQKDRKFDFKMFKYDI